MLCRIGMAALHRTREANDEGGRRLPAHHRQDLADVARGVPESRAGIRTRYIPDDVHGEPGEDGVRMHEAERYAQDNDVWGSSCAPGAVPWLRRVARARRALDSLRVARQHRHADVLMVAHGYPDPIVRSWPKPVADFFDDLCSLVRYTDATEERRKKLVRAETLRRIGGALDRSGALTMEAVRSTDRVVVHGEAPPGQLYEIARAWAVEASADRIVTSGDALRDALAPFPEAAPRKAPDEPEEAHKARREAWEQRANHHASRRTSFVVRAKAEANVMLVAAEDAYRAAWLAAR